MKTQAQIDAANQYQSYRKGWRAGASGSAMDPIAANHDDSLIRHAYHLGYTAGCIARNEAGQFASKKYGYEPQILRLAEEDHGKSDDQRD